MNEFTWLTADTINIVSLSISVVVLLLVALIWFFMNRASLRANEHIALLEELVDLQKRQNSLLRRLCEANECEPVVDNLKDTDPDDGLVRMVAER